MFATTHQEHSNSSTFFTGCCSFCVELVGGSSKKQNWKGLGIALLVITVICSFIILAIYLTATRQPDKHRDLIPFTLKDIFNVKPPKPWNGTWISDVHYSYPDINGSIWIYNCQTNENLLLFKWDNVQQENVGDGIVSPSARYILIPISKGKIRPYYTEYDYDLYEGSKLISSINKTLFVSAILFSNTDNLIVFIHNFNIFIYDIDSSKTRQITNDGHKEDIHNGIIEWIYEYDIFNDNVLLYWSPTDRYLAFVKLNLTSVPKNNYLTYNSFTNDKYTIPYPKSGDSLPFIDVYVYNVNTGETIKVPRPLEYDPLKSNVYIFHVVWCGDTCLAVVYANRAQNSSIIQLYTVEGNKVVLKKYYIEQARKGWIPANFLRPVFDKQGTYAFIVRFNQFNFDKYGKSYPQIVRIHFGQSIPQIDRTSTTNIPVDRIIHVEDKDTLYFTGSRGDPRERQFYKWMVMQEYVEPECLSCYDENCSYSGAQFSKNNGSYFILECFGPDIPYSRLYKHSGIISVAKIQDNQPFRQWLDSKLLPYIDFFNVTLDAKKNIIGYGMIIFPPWYNPNATISSYPVIVAISEKLNIQRVTKKFPLFLQEYYHVTKENISIVLFDGHGSSGQDEDYLKSDHVDWFHRQHDDYIQLAQHLKYREKRLGNTLNETRFGLKARGSAALIALRLLEENNKDKDEYICAFLQSPVNKFSHYHAVYTERINGLNSVHIDQSTSTYEIGNKSLAIVHGMSDEVVHFQHSAIFAKTFVGAGKNFEFKVYPDSDYYFENDRPTYEDYFRFEIRFFQECLGSRVVKERKPIVVDDSNE